MIVLFSYYLIRSINQKLLFAFFFGVFGKFKSTPIFFLRGDTASHVPPSQPPSKSNPVTCKHYCRILRVTYNISNKQFCNLNTFFHIKIKTNYSNLKKIGQW